MATAAVRRAGLAICLAAVSALLLLSACAGGEDASGTVSLPPTTGVFDYQLGGAYDRLAESVDSDSEGASIDVVARDATAAILPGAYNICYVNGFQTQPGDTSWLDRSELLVSGSNGNPLVDPDWPDEYIFNPSTPEQRAAILDRIGPVIDGCARSGFDAVEIDNLDTWTRFAGVPKDGAFELARSYVARAHAGSLAIAQKNSAEATSAAHEELGFDFAVTESCAAWDECDMYTDVYGGHVLSIEYPSELAQAGLSFEESCELPGRAPLAILRDRDLLPPAQREHVYEQCERATRTQPPSAHFTPTLKRALSR